MTPAAASNSMSSPKRSPPPASPSMSSSRSSSASTTRSLRSTGNAVSSSASTSHRTDCCPMPDIQIISNNGHLIGASTDEAGNVTLYDGVKIHIGFDELDVVTTVAEDGESFDRVTSWRDEVIAKGTTTRDGFLSAWMSRVPEDANVTEQMRENAWQEEIDQNQHQKVYVQALVDGEFQTVEKTFT